MRTSFTILLKIKMASDIKKRSPDTRGRSGLIGCMKKVCRGSAERRWRTGKVRALFLLSHDRERISVILQQLKSLSTSFYF